MTDSTSKVVKLNLLPISLESLSLDLNIKIKFGKTEILGTVIRCDWSPKKLVK